jgi:hypothetical protein
MTIQDIIYFDDNRNKTKQHTPKPKLFPIHLRSINTSTTNKGVVLLCGFLAFCGESIVVLFYYYPYIQV